LIPYVASRIHYFWADACLVFTIGSQGLQERGKALSRRPQRVFFRQKLNAFFECLARFRAGILPKHGKTQ